jgi:hypothetical protein
MLKIAGRRDRADDPRIRWIQARAEDAAATLPGWDCPTAVGCYVGLGPTGGCIVRRCSGPDGRCSQHESNVQLAGHYSTCDAVST